MTQTRPGYNPERMVRLIREAIARCRLDLTGKVVLTEAATGAYAVTPVIAAMAGAAKVYAVAKSGAHGSRNQAIRETKALADEGGAWQRIRYATNATGRMLAEADVVTNSGHLRPLDAQKIGFMKPDAVIPLMYEAWEFRPGDVDLAMCRRKGIRIVATNEQHPKIDVFGYLGVLALKQLMDAGISAYKSSILLLSDNDFGPYIEKALRRAGAAVDINEGVGRNVAAKTYDAILLALSPRRTINLNATDVGKVARFYPGTILVQFFGDLDRPACQKYKVPVWPLKAPGKGHMGILPSDIGPEATIRLQTGGLKSAEDALNPSCVKGGRGQFLDSNRVSGKPKCHA